MSHTSVQYSTVQYSTVQTMLTVQTIQASDSFTLLVVAGGADPGVPPHQGHPQQARRLHRLLAPRLHLRQVKRSTLVSHFVSGPLLFVFDEAIFQHKIRNFGLFQAKTSNYGL